MTKPKKALQDKEEKTSAKRFIMISLGVTVLLMILLYFLFRNTI